MSTSCETDLNYVRNVVVKRFGPEYKIANMCYKQPVHVCAMVKVLRSDFAIKHLALWVKVGGSLITVSGFEKQWMVKVRPMHGLLSSKQVLSDISYQRLVKYPWSVPSRFFRSQADLWPGFVCSLQFRTKNVLWKLNNFIFKTGLWGSDYIQK